VEPVLGIAFRRPRHKSGARVHEVDVAIIGAGPYGLSLAAHLKHLGVEHQVFGTPMNFWRNSMPPGMELKSEGPACDLFDGRSEFPIEDFYREISRPFIAPGDGESAKIVS
jgi:FAD-dependent urate hydroxylase